MKTCKACAGRVLVTGAAFGVLALARLGHASNAEFGSHVPAIAEQIARSGKHRIAVVDFTDLQGDVTELGRFLAEELSVGLAAAAKGFDVIDRTHLENLLAEHRLSTRGLIDPQTTLKLKVAGVQGLLTGTVIPLGDNVRVTLKVLDVETAKISAPTDVDIPKTPAIQALIERGVEREQDNGPSASMPRAPLRLRQMVNKIALEVKGCRLVGGTAVCQLSITSIENDVSLWFHDFWGKLPTRVLDEDGTEYAAGEMKLGGSARTEASLAAGVPMSLSFSFVVAETTRRLALLEVSFQTNKGGCKAQFRNIQLMR